ncbi:hypothetical protein [Burkholderia sp. Nafp2/4-1b]|uniref:hypothetical protein n=1 Tax=Burkholderia sp. Nafp2/4-1b TaxID=2116686 RepID=UPI0013CEEA02|nr:hypothetical protein [Burkholderia sp. Nafp2/4-1b]
MVRNVFITQIESAAHASVGNAVTDFASLINDWTTSEPTPPSPARVAHADWRV